ncbi:zinc-binding oxidoreductase-like protein ToxD [Boeremia exigua]|uniref:zinc-binding oxidoreductase-like protein ToxD n=1 Tax=Boeremia exigua TaxID=749465 RepID=UPI001E8D1D8C|nr:zinc-binding oxidoreductase-like protein ToxD [Boeremia exigua]KAH6639298.1 zinc-binding oxidoreductase-like protein ToxD [Boeremia exigua]
MKEVIIAKGLKTTIQDAAIPEPQPDQIVIQVVVSGSNPKDWKIPDWIPDYNANSGDDIAGIVHSVGSNVWEFKKGDRVASFHEMMTPGGSFAEYAVGWQHTTFHLPKSLSFEDAATIPLAAMTAALGLHQRLGLPDPWTPATEPTPLVVYGGASAVGAYAIKLAVLANIHPIIAVAGRGEKFVEDLIDRSKGDTIIDYRKGNEAVVQGLKDALKGEKLWYAFDATSEHGSYTNIAQVLEPTGHLTTVLPGKTYEGVPETVKLTTTNVGASHKDDKDYAYIMFRYFARGLAEGFFKPHPYEVIPGGLAGVQTGLQNLKDGKASGVKYVFRIAETEGIKSAL